MKYIYFISILSIFFFGCKKNPEPIHDCYLSNEDKEWNIYHVNQNITFISNIGNSLNFVTQSVQTHMYERTMVNDETGNQTYKYECIDISLKRTDSTDFISLTISRGYSYPDAPLVLLFSWSKFYPGLFNIAVSANETLTINNVTYYNVIKFISPNNSSILYYHKQKGFLKFENINGQNWERSN